MSQTNMSKLEQFLVEFTSRSEISLTDMRKDLNWVFEVIDPPVPVGIRSSIIKEIKAQMAREILQKFNDDTH